MHALTERDLIWFLYLQWNLGYRQMLFNLTQLIFLLVFTTRTLMLALKLNCRTHFILEFYFFSFNEIFKLKIYAYFLSIIDKQMFRKTYILFYIIHFYKGSSFLFEVVWYTANISPALGVGSQSHGADNNNPSSPGEFLQTDHFMNSYIKIKLIWCFLVTILKHRRFK